MGRNAALLAAAIVVLFLRVEVRGGRPHISNLNVLLPPRTTTPVRYRLQGSDGCFVWTWDHHDIIDLVPEYNGTAGDCSTSAMITPLAPFEERQATAVHATDIATGEILRCEVFVDRIARIQIFHHSVKLDLDGWATLRIRAFDAEENVFSSLVGLRFAWQLSSFDSTTETVPQKLLHVPLKDSPWSDCGCSCGDIDTQIELEEKGFGSDLFVVRGVSTGQERIKAKLVEPRMKELEDTLILTVAEAISLEPHSPLYIIPGTSLQFKLRAMRKNVLSEIPLPSAYHQWSVADETIASIDQRSGLVVAKTVGLTNVIVEDVRVKGHQQTASLHVVVPTRLELFLLPLLEGEAKSRKLEKPSGDPWYIVSGRDYVVTVRAFSPDSGTRALYLTQSNDLRLPFTNLPYWEARELDLPTDVAVQYGNATLLKAKAEGAGNLAAKLSYVDNLETKVLTVEQMIVVCSLVKIIPEDAKDSRTIFLPWSPGSSQEYQLKAEGGCGEKFSDYAWLSTDQSVAIISPLGTIQSKGPGRAIILVSSANDPLNKDEIEVEVSTPTSIDVVHGLPVESEVNTLLPAAVTLISPAGQFYSRCDAYNPYVQWDIIGDDGNFKLADSSAPVSKITSYLKPEDSFSQVICAGTMINPMRPGRATITGSLRIPTAAADSPTMLEKSWMIAAYAPLSLQLVSDGKCCGGFSCGGDADETACNDLKELLLVVGNGARVMLTGGPERWRQESQSQFVEFHEIVSTEAGVKASEEVIVARSTDGSGRTFFIACTGFGNYTLMFRRGYQDLEGPVNIVASSTLLLVCDVPSSIVLIVDEPDNSLANIKSVLQSDRDEEGMRLTPVTVINSRSIRVAAVALHSSGRPFANASSMALSWRLEYCDDLALWDDPERPQKAWERTISLQSTAGLCAVRATMRPSALRLSLLSVLQDAAKLQLVAALRLEPKETLLFSHPDAKATLQVLGGTNDIEPHVNDSRIAVVIHPVTGPRVSELVVAARGLGTAVVSILDVGLASPASATALVHVADIAWIKVLPEVLSMELGEVTEVRLEVGDNSGRIFPVSQFALFSIHAHLQDDVISLLNPELTQILGNTFLLRGADLGFSSFHITAQKASGREIRSAIVKVEVYARLKIVPSPLVLAPGAQFMLVVHGGPRAGKVIEFSSSESLIATVDRNSGLVTAKSEGNEVILARASDRDGRFLGEAFTEITVSIPLSMFLEVRGGQLGIGREMSIFPYSNEGDLFSFYEMCTNYDWVIANEEVLQIESVKWTQKDRSDDQVDPGFSARIIGKSAGTTTVSLSFDCHFRGLGGHSTLKNYTASGSIIVVPDPPLALGMLATWVLPPGHRSSNLLPQRTVDGSISRPVTYTILHDGRLGGDIFTLEDGRIVTSDRIDVGCVHTKDRDAGRSEIAVCIRVAEIAQMTVGNGVHPSELSVGTQHSFVVNLRDNIGTPFFEVDLETSPLYLETNRADVVSFKTTKLETFGAVTIAVQALRQGKALIRISRNNIADYVLVFVGAYVYPRNPVMHIGDRLNFSIGSSSANTDRGQWFSGNNRIIYIDSRTGEAEAVSEGSTVVGFNSSRLTASTTLSVVGISAVIVESPKVPFLTNVRVSDQGYRFTVIFKDTHGHDVGFAAETRSMTYDCIVKPAFLGRATPFHDPDSGFYCLFFPYAPEKLSFNLHRSKRATSDVGDAKGRIGLTITAAIAAPGGATGSATSTFAGGFSIIDTPSELHLSITSNRSRIAVVGTVGSIAVSWQRKDAVDVKRLTSTPELGVCGHAVYEVLLLGEDKTFTDKLVFLLTTTGQREEISMSYDAGQFTVAALSQQIFTVAVITLVAIVLPVFLCTKLLDLPRSLRHSSQSQSPSRSPPRRRPMVSQLVQDDGTAGVLMDGQLDDTSYQTPPPVKLRTFSRSPPQPYTDYMDRTLEQTPYFSRHDARRADPSRTY